MYHRINAWLEREIVTRNLPYFITLAILCAWITTIFGQMFLSLWDVQLSNGNVSDIRQMSSFWAFTNFMIPVVMMEELIYRAPLVLVAHFSRPLIIPSILVSSVLFGWAHGDWTNIFVQGVDGIIFSVVFLKCGGMRNNLPKGLLSATIAHILFDMSVWTLVALR